MRQRLLYLDVCIIATIAYLHVHFGLVERFYWTLWWWDILLHVLGGCAVGLGAIWAQLVVGKKPSFAVSVGIVAAVGVIWEIYEYSVFGTSTAISMPYPLDTAKDLLDDCIGGLLAGFLIIRTRWV